MPFLFQPLRGFFHLATRQAIDDAGVGRAVRLRVLSANEVEQLRARIVLFDDAIADVRAIEAGDEDPRIVQRQPVDDLVARDGVGGSGERDARHVRKALVQHRQLNIFGPEIVPPLRNAMRFVDGEQADARALEQLLETRRHQPFRRDVQQIDLALAQRALGCQRLQGQTASNSDTPPARRLP